MFTPSHLRDPRSRPDVPGRRCSARSPRPRGSSLWLWDGSPYGRYLHHDDAAGPGCRSRLGLFVVGWALMIVAMMLPTAHPAADRRSARSSVDAAGPAARRARCSSATSLAWTAFGLAAWIGDRGVHAARRRDPVARRAPAVHPRRRPSPSPGSDQFSPSAYRCLDECRSPARVRHEPLARAVAERREALRDGHRPRRCSASAAAGR